MLLTSRPFFWRQKSCWRESGDLSRLYFSLCQKRGEKSDFPIFADLGSVSVVRSSNFADFHISPMRTWICTPLSADFTNFGVLKNFDRRTFTKKRTFHQIMGISDLNHLVHLCCWHLFASFERQQLQQIFLGIVLFVIRSGECRGGRAPILVFPFLTIGEIWRITGNVEAKKGSMRYLLSQKLSHELSTSRAIYSDTGLYVDGKIGALAL